MSGFPRQPVACFRILPHEFRLTILIFCALCAPGSPLGGPKVCSATPIQSAAEDGLHPEKQSDAQEKSGGWRLADSSSLYLREHAENPVEWYPWGDEAFARAKELDRPVFLSIGYSSCHWCHVMRRESFSDPKIAQYLADHFVSIKVDREDLPHIDAVYMDAVTAMSGRGGWPLTVFLTGDRKPFFGGTYFPPKGAPGQPGFTDVIEHIELLWRTQRDGVFGAGTALVDHLKSMAERSFDAIGTKEYLELGLSQARERFDSRFGGWRVAPKFPDPRLIDVLIASSRLGGPKSDEQMAILTLKKMRAGGIYDQIRGGFHRYSVDARWAVPHFEKMLYSQGQLGESYAEAFRLTGDRELAEAARGILDAMLLDFRLENGAFASSFDADSGGEEGTYYVWSPEQIDELFGEADANLVKSALGISAEGNFEGGMTVLSKAKTSNELAQEFKLGPPQVQKTLERAFRLLVEKRGSRVPPKRDDKVILGWNATAISALAKGAVALRDDRYRRAAEAAIARLREEKLVSPARFSRRLAGGTSDHPAALADCALYLKAVLDTYEASFDPALVEHAREVAEWIERDFAGTPRAPESEETAGSGETADGGAYYSTPAGIELIVPRRKPHFGSALPSANGTHARNLLRLHALTGDARFQARADGILRESLAATGQAPSAAPELLIAALMRQRGIPEIVIAGDLRNPVMQGFLEPSLRGGIPYRVLAHRPIGEAGVRAEEMIPILKDRAPIAGRPTAWFCENGVCQAPTQDFKILRATIEAWLAPPATAPPNTAPTNAEAVQGED